MQVFELVGAVIALLVTLGVGTIAHELTHATVLRALGVPYDLEWRPDPGATGLFGLGVSRAWASVTPRSIPDDVSSRGLRLSAIAPLALAVPPFLSLAGVLPNPLASNDAVLVAATVAWFGCALPSPQDFSLFWYAERAIEECGESPPGR